MHATVITCDFLLAPAFCDPEFVMHRVADLAEYASSAQAHNERPLLEPDATQKLIEAKQYPCVGLFKNNLASVDEPIYTAKDISRIVSNLLAVGEEFSYSERRLWECSERSVAPACPATSGSREAEINTLIEQVSVFNELESADLSILYFFPENPVSTTAFSATLTEVVPPPPLPLPHSLNRIIRFYADYREYLTSVCYQASLQENPENAALMREGFFWGALCALKQKGEPLDLISPRSFGLGTQFVESLKNNQCLPGQKFWGACFSSIVAVLTAAPEYEINIFRKNGKSPDQKMSGQYKAYRSHLTKGGVALRLMFWEAEDGYIELANVGPKNELFIAPPG